MILASCVACKPCVTFSRLHAVLTASAAGYPREQVKARSYLFDVRLENRAAADRGRSHPCPHS